jgi:DNA mismatch endonuclease (patch repair protein)
MSLIRGKGNKQTEQALLALLKRDKITGWRRHLPLPGKPDFAFTKQKVAVFVDGCFWHGCPKCYTRPKTNRKFWDNTEPQGRFG